MWDEIILYDKKKSFFSRIKNIFRLGPLVCYQIVNILSICFISSMFLMTVLSWP